MSTPSAADVLAQVERSLAVHSRVVLCQIVRVQGSTPGKLGWKMLVRPDGTFMGNLGGGSFEALVLRDATSLLAGDQLSHTERYYLTEDAVKGQPTGMVCGGMIEVFLEVVAARPVLAVCGGGPVGQALATQAALCDFEIVVLEDRPQFLGAELFPQGTRRVEVTRDYAGDVLGAWQARELFVAVVSRCWETDLAALSAVLRSKPPGLRYLGLMGSRRKIARVESGLESAGLDLEGVPWRAPIGLSLGATTPAEIAVSIVAELIRERNPGLAEKVPSNRAVRLV
jgi:xanthine dehydrogenase accessory factor